MAIIAHPPPLGPSPEREDSRMLSRHWHTNTQALALLRLFPLTTVTRLLSRAAYRCFSPRFARSASSRSKTSFASSLVQVPPARWNARGKHERGGMHLLRCRLWEKNL